MHVVCPEKHSAEAVCEIFHSSPQLLYSIQSVSIILIENISNKELKGRKCLLSHGVLCRMLPSTHKIFARFSSGIILPWGRKLSFDHDLIHTFQNLFLCAPRVQHM